MNLIPKTVLLVSLSIVPALVYAVPPANPGRLDEVAERGRHVMPFDLEKTLHVFNKTEHGGLQQVIVKDAGDGEQIGLIRRHLSEIAAGFRQGNFSRQRRIHGDDMPGLADMAAEYKHIGFDYRELPNGAEIEFSAEEPALVDAIHRYFNAQLSDHARHAVGGHVHQCHHKPHSHCRHGENKPTGSEE